ncbi:GNAT family N-acetyltransferase [Embleya sp. NPDC001921]
MKESVDGLVTRTVTPTVPVTATDELTNLGFSLHQLMHGIKDWAETHMDEVLTRREEYDAASSERRPRRDADNHHPGARAAASLRVPRRRTTAGAARHRGSSIDFSGRPCRLVGPWACGNVPSAIAAFDFTRRRPRRAQGSGLSSDVVTEPEITIATPAERTQVIASLVAAFTDDPVLRYLFPDKNYPAHAATFFGRLFDKRVHKKTIWTVGHGSSVAIWEPPATDDDPSSESWHSPLPDDALARVHAYDGAVHNALPTEPFWYLGVLGTHPEHAGRRWGHTVMKAGLRRAAEDDLPAVLETGNPANVEVYRRAGWEISATVTEPLPIWIMRRTPR